MSVELFRERLNRSRLHPNDIKWMPSWFSQFAAGRPVVDGLVWFNTDDVLKFLQKLRDAKVECWQRLQAARSLEWYQMMVLRVSTVDFTEFKLKLQEMDEKQKRSQVSKDSPLLDDEGIAGEGKPGLVDPNEPRPVQELRAHASSPTKDRRSDPRLCKSCARVCDFSIIQFQRKTLMRVGSAGL